MPLPLGDTEHHSGPPLISDPGGLALQRLVSRGVTRDEIPSVIETLVSNLKAADIAERLRGKDTQTFIDILDEACHHAIPSLKNWIVDTLSNPLFLFSRL